MFSPPTLCCRLQRSHDALVLDVARLRLEDAIAVHERTNPSSTELPALRQCLKELLQQLSVPFLPLSMSAASGVTGAPAFGAPRSPAPAFGSTVSTPSFGAAGSTPAFGAANAAPAFGAPRSPAPAFGSTVSTPSFGSSTT